MVPGEHVIGAFDFARMLRKSVASRKGAIKALRESAFRLPTPIRYVFTFYRHYRLQASIVLYLSFDLQDLTHICHKISTQ